MGAALLFAEAPGAELPEAHVRVLRYREQQRGAGRRQQVTEDLRVEGPLAAQIEGTRDAIAHLVPTRRALDPRGIFTDVTSVPGDAWMEGLVNAVTQRSYSVIGDHIRAEIFDDRIEIVLAAWEEAPSQRRPRYAPRGAPTSRGRCSGQPRVPTDLGAFPREVTPPHRTLHR